jgi:hypothetical protein
MSKKKKQQPKENLPSPSVKQEKSKDILNLNTTEDIDKGFTTGCFNITPYDDYNHYLWMNILCTMEELHFIISVKEKEDDDEEDEKYLFHRDLINIFLSSDRMFKATAKLISLYSLDLLSEIVDPDPVCFSEEEIFSFTQEVIKSISEMFDEVESETLVLFLQEPKEPEDKENLSDKTPILSSPSQQDPNFKLN